MTGVGWRAEGIERARAAGGVDLDVYLRPGFSRVTAVRVTRCERGYIGSGIQGFATDPDPGRETVGEHR